MSESIWVLPQWMEFMVSGLIYTFMIGVVVFIAPQLLGFQREDLLKIKLMVRGLKRA
ncbi:MAG: hypothetical protein GXP14_11090 [Gammaproteobacteria bacterium]|nr:hypothetical protein [Gammaproteobacteria bacterium]